MIFHYQVLDKNKQLYQGDIEADSLKRAKLLLMKEGYDIVMLESADSKFVKKGLGSIGIVPLKEKMLFIKHLSLMIKSGMVLDESIEALYDNSKGRMKFILYRLLSVVRKGSTLSDGLALFPHTFNEFFINLIRVGEQSGTLEQSLLNLSIKLKKDNDLKSKVRGAMMYPMIIMTALLGLGFAMTVFVLPKLMVLFRSLGTDIPITTRIFLAFADFLSQYWILVLIGIIAVIASVATTNALKRTRITIHWLVFHLPIFHKFSSNSNLANFCRSMSLMLKSGVPIDESIEVVSRALSNELYRRSMLSVLELVKKGDSLSDSLNRFPHLFPSLVVKMVHVGEISANLAETFEYLAEFFEDEMDNLSRNLSTVLEPILLLVMGISVGFVAISIISPIYQLSSGVNAGR